MITWKLIDHLCKVCGGRMLVSASGAGPTPGGNPIYRCADCGNGGAQMGPDSFCWCGFNHRHQNLAAYRCVPFSLIKQRPEIAQKLINAFRSCGCEPGRGEVGIMLDSDYCLALKSLPEQKQ